MFWPTFLGGSEGTRTVASFIPCLCPQGQFSPSRSYCVAWLVGFPWKHTSAFTHTIVPKTIPVHFRIVSFCYTFLSSPSSCSLHKQCIIFFIILETFSLSIERYNLLTLSFSHSHFQTLSIARIFLGAKLWAHGCFSPGCLIPSIVAQTSFNNYNVMYML